MRNWPIVKNLKMKERQEKETVQEEYKKKD